VVEPGDAAGLRAAAREIVEASEERKADWARRGRAWVNHFRRSRVLGEFEARLHTVVAGIPPRSAG
jgi:colanic acid biosynthesis glycosyl transferase WcaI